MAHPTKWGILSAGMISQDYVTAMKQLPQEEHQVVAVAARNIKQAEEFAARFDIKKAYGSYIELAEDPDVEVVYIGNINTCHCECTKLMLNHNKAVVCEKPLAINVKQAEEMIKLSNEKGLFLLEGIFSRFFPIYDILYKHLAENAYGKIKFLNVNFGIDIWNFAGSATKNSHGGGSLFAIGVYPVNLALILFNELPEKIEANAIIPNKPNDVDKFISITMYFSDERIAQFNLHLNAWMSNSATITTESGFVEIPDFWAPCKLITPTKTYEIPLPSDEEKKYTLPHSRAFIYEINAVRESLLKGEKEHPLYPHSESLRAMKIYDQIRKIIGLSYDADRE